MKYIVLLWLTLLVGCSSMTDKTDYVGGVPYPDGPLEVGKHYSFRFIEKWRISHDWLIGTGTAMYRCLYGGNAFKDVGGYGDLGAEPNGPMFEIRGMIYQGSTFPDRPSKIILGDNIEEILGINPTTGKFKGYHPFCTFGLISPRVGLSIFIVKPDSAKGTDEWVKDAKPVKLNGLNWLLQKRPVIDISQYRADIEPDHTVERWVLKIPDTAYWMVLKLSASSGKSDSKYKTGTIYHPAEWQRIQDLFHQIVASVRLEPITPIPLPNGLTLKELAGTPTKPNMQR